MNFIRGLFCKHEWEYRTLVTSVFGTIKTGQQEVFICKKYLKVKRVKIW